MRRALLLMTAMAATCAFGAPPAFVRVPDGPLLWTEQLLPREGSRDAGAQMNELLDQLEGVLAKAGGDLAGVARLNVYATDDRAVAAAAAAVEKRFAKAQPAVTVVRSPVAKAGARVACDAVARVTSDHSGVQHLAGGGAVMPAGGKVFISGQAVRGTDLASAVRLTMAGLQRSLAHLGLSKTDVVQVKAFIKPFSEHAAVAREVAVSFEGAAPPPAIVLEWKSDLFAEIELVASAGPRPTKADERITHAWLPWLTKSTRFCNVTHIAAGTPLIFIGGIDGGETGDARAQMKTVFARLGSTLFDAGSSYRHLAKATYYLAHTDARALLTEIRDVYYDPTRPPAASALDTNGLGYPGRAVMLDLIAVPR